MHRDENGGASAASAIGTIRNRSIWSRRLIVAAIAVEVCNIAHAEWPQWGGPTRDFTVNTSGLANAWPESGPTRLWHRELGVGYSAIVADDDLIFTMYRKEITSRYEITVAMDAKTGRTVWEHKIAAPTLEPPDQRHGGQGPNATPLLVGDYLYTLGSNSALHCFEKKTGKIVWKHDLIREYEAQQDRYVGQCGSPIAYRNMVIVPGGRQTPPESQTENHEAATGNTLIAFDQHSGKLIWKALEFGTTYSSAILIEFDGRDQLVLCVNEGVISVDPINGDLLWHHRTGQQYTSVTPVWNGKDLLFFSEAGTQAQGRALRLATEDGKTSVTELWNNRKIRVSQPTPVVVGNQLVGATDKVLLGFDFRTGERKWVQRGFPNASCVFADGKIIVLDENGQLTLASVTPEGVTVHSNCKVAERHSFTVPTLTGKTLYIRDRKHIMALDLG